MFQTSRRIALIALMTPIVIAGPAGAEDWAQWRGPEQDGSVVAPGQFPEAGFDLGVAWKRTIGAGRTGRDGMT